MRCAGFTLGRAPSCGSSPALPPPAAGIERRADSLAPPSRPSQAKCGSNVLRSKYGKFPVGPLRFRWSHLALPAGHSHLSITAPAAETPTAQGFSDRRNRGFDFCRFCHDRVLTGKSAPPITRLVADERPCGPPVTISEKGRRAAGQPEAMFCSQKLGSLASTDAALERGIRGPLLVIVKMEERETWTARFLRFDREIERIDFDGTFLEVHTTSHARFAAKDRMCVLVNFASKDAKRKRANVDQVRFQT